MVLGRVLRFQPSYAAHSINEERLYVLEFLAHANKKDVKWCSEINAFK